MVRVKSGVCGAIIVGNEVVVCGGKGSKVDLLCERGTL